jgi:EAL domain-containing protein (putative c-di-GMP-specific phosphodiesterase class I)
VAEKVRAALGSAKSIDGKAYAASASIGVSLFPSPSGTVGDLIGQADIAMYKAKGQGRNTIVLFEGDMQARLMEQFGLMQDLRAALESTGLQLHLQSKVDAQGAVVGAEALIRWHHPTRGLMLPAMFMPATEENGLMTALGDWVLRQTCQVIVKLSEAGLSRRIAVNISPSQFHQSQFVPRVKQILRETGADPLYLIIEITENLLVDRTSEIVSRMLELGDLGIRFSIDDFGTGYSSLSYLNRLPLHELKIDKSFVQDLPEDADSATLVETILSMAHHLKLVVVAEGIENQRQFQYLKDLRCELFQGYLFHRPQAAPDWLASQMGTTPPAAGV